ncbi:uncharacterized protein LOC127247745 [Andrographis paniculata]|uniref:uncharacterized protein LOC127247745 n=1 Tax=Andrographis paniculata TaxID=175694 RepID=UPI0021E7B49E|nr:uncharacterized protein LOC127247745 [Andrographis paniculata]
MESYSDHGITLRPLQIADADDFFKWYSDEKVSQFCSWNTFTSKEAAVQYVAHFVIPQPWQRAICLNNRPVGCLSVSPFRGEDRCRAELGYVVASDYWGKGIATRAVQMAANAVFVEWTHLERLEAVVAVENPASQRVLEKVGFRREGILRKYYLLKGKPKDVVMFSLISTEM